MAVRPGKQISNQLEIMRRSVMVRETRRINKRNIETW